MKINKEKNFISCVVYVNDSSSNLKNFLTQLYDTMSNNFEKYEIICVNDASVDESIDIIKDVASTFTECVLSIINMSYYHGTEQAINAGIELALGDFVFEFDTTVMDYDSNLLLEVYNHSLTGFDIVCATNGKIKPASKLFYTLYNLNTQFTGKLTSETFRIISRRAINRIYSMSKTVPYRKALYASCGLKLATITYKSLGYKKTRSNKKLTKNRQNTAITTFILFTDLAYKFSMIMTMSMMTLTLVGIVYTIIVFAVGQPVPGYTTIMLLLTGSFFGVFSILAIIIKYLSIIVDLIFSHRSYLIESIEKITGE